MQYTWQLVLVLVPVYFIKHSVSCYICYIIGSVLPHYMFVNTDWKMFLCMCVGVITISVRLVL